VTKLFGFWIALGGTFLASYIVRKVGLMTSLLVSTVAGSASHLSLAWLARAPANRTQVCGKNLWTVWRSASKACPCVLG
jgi:hypothetical protein